MKQFVLPDLTGDGSHELRLGGREFHYLIHVRRYGVGDSIPALSPDGTRYEMTLVAVNSDHCLAALNRLEPEGVSDITEPSVRITLMPGITRGKKMDLTVRQAVEAGASSIRPLLTDHSQIRFRGEEEALAKKARWERIAVEALQQCGGRTPSSVELPLRLKDAMAVWGNRGPIFFLHEQLLDIGKAQASESGLFSRLAGPIGELAIIVGPEGGLSPDEVRYLNGIGACPVHLGNRVLRAETAAIYGLAAVGTIIRERTEWQPA